MNVDGTVVVLNSSLASEMQLFSASLDGLRHWEGRSLA